MRTQNGRRANCAKYIQLIQLVWTESRASTQYSSIVYWHDFLPMPTVLAVFIWRNIIIFHFAGSSIYNLFIYDCLLSGRVQPFWAGGDKRLFFRDVATSFQSSNCGSTELLIPYLHVPVTTGTMTQQRLWLNC